MGTPGCSQLAPFPLVCVSAAAKVEKIKSQWNFRKHLFCGKSIASEHNTCALYYFLKVLLHIMFHRYTS